MTVMRGNKFMGEDTVVLDSILLKYQRLTEPARDVAGKQRLNREAFRAKITARRELKTAKFQN